MPDLTNADKNCSDLSSEPCIPASPLMVLRGIRSAYLTEQMALELDQLEIYPGRVYAVVGPNGAGKSTLFKVMTGLLQPQEGSLQWQDQEMIPLTSGVPKQLRRKIILVRQHPLLFRTSVFRNVAYGLKLRGWSRRAIASRVMAELERVDMADCANRSARHLSGGETQRVALAQALVLQPEVLLLDEPTANLDTQSGSIVETVIQGFRQHRHATVLFTTHDMAQAHRLSDDIIALEKGQRVNHTPENIWRGQLVKGDDITCFDTGRLQVILPDHYRTASCIAIAPADIVLSSLPLSSSARNNFTGQVVKVNTLGSELDVVVDIGEWVQVRITRQSYNRLGIAIGGTVYVTFKASAVRVYV